MGLFSKHRETGEVGALTLSQAWTMLGQRLDLTFEVITDDAVRASGVINGRAVEVEIAAGGGAVKGAISDVVEGFSGRRRKGGGKRRPWSTTLSVACANPRHLQGTLTSMVDIDDPAWDPRNFDPSHCRALRADPPELASELLSPSVRERLMDVPGDISITIAAGQVGLSTVTEVREDAGYIAGSIIHQLARSVPTWPERGITGPPWWIDTLCLVADEVDATPASG